MHDLVRQSSRILTAFFTATAILLPFAPALDAQSRRSIPQMQLGPHRIPEEPTLYLRDLGNLSKKGDETLFRIVSPSENYQESGVVALIKAHAAEGDAPLMPQLQASLDDLPSDFWVSWRFDVNFTRPNRRHLAGDQLTFPKEGVVELAADTPWKIYESYNQHPFFGGDATITFQIHSPDKLHSTRQFQYRFRIGGENPTEELATKYIDRVAAELARATNQPEMWYASAVAKSETKYAGGTKPDEKGRKPAPYYHQFLQRGYKEDPKVKPKNPQTYKPNWNHDGFKEDKTPKVGGFGIFQVTGNAQSSDANVPREVIWNWQKNVQAGINILAAKQRTAFAWLAKQRKKAQDAPPIPPIVVSPQKGMDVVFRDGTSRTAADVVTIKAYNGSSRPRNPRWRDPDREPPPPVFGYTGAAPSEGYYVYWCSMNKRWCLSRYNGWKKPFNYVDRVCLEVRR